MSAVRGARETTPDPWLASLCFGRMQANDLPEVLQIENDVYPYPWTRGNFLDSLYSGYETWTLRENDGALAGYFLLMQGVDETHLLNISVRRDLQGRGVGQRLLGKVAALSREKGAGSILLEVRPSNRRALDIYLRYGFRQIGLRKGYYPAGGDMREDALVMRCET